MDSLRGGIRGKQEIKRFERELKEYFQKRHCFLVSSGRAALALILEALKERYPGRDKVLIPAFTCYSVPSAVTRAGLRVVLCDLAADSFDYDYQKLRPLLADERLLCIVSQHLYGIAADLESLREMLGPSPVAIIEDAAQAMGATWKGRRLGGFGDVGFFSLGRGKPLSIVEGGIILTDRDDLAEILACRYGKLSDYSFSEVSTLFLYALALRVFLNPALFCLPQGLPFLRLGETLYDPGFRIRKMSPLQGGMARGWAGRLAELRAKRLANAEYWQGVESAGGFRPCFRKQGECCDLLRYPIEVSDGGLRDWLVAEGSRLGLGMAPGYPDSIDGIGELNGDLRGQSYPEAKGLAKRLLTLPVHPFLSAKDRHRIEGLLKQSEGTSPWR